MSLLKSRKMTGESLAAHQANARQSHGPATPRGQAESAAANLRHGFYASTRVGAFARLGEDPLEYARLVDSLFDDLQSRAGLETELVRQMVEALWVMQRSQRMQEGLAVKRIEKKALQESFPLNLQAGRAIELLEPFERLESALARPDGPTAEEVHAFSTSREEAEDTSTQEFLGRLESLLQTKDKGERRALRRKLREDLRQLKEPYFTSAWRLTSIAKQQDSPECLAALAAPQEESSLFLQRMEDSHLRRFCRITDTLIKLRSGFMACQKMKNEGRSRKLIENTGAIDIMPDVKSDFVSENHETAATL